MHLHLLLLLMEQVLLPVPVVAAPQHILVHLLRIAASITYMIFVPLVHRIVCQCSWQEVGGGGDREQGGGERQVVRGDGERQLRHLAGQPMASGGYWSCGAACLDC